jgi:hypothetical protein
MSIANFALSILHFALIFYQKEVHYAKAIVNAVDNDLWNIRGDGLRRSSPNG